MSNPRLLLLLSLLVPAAAVAEEPARQEDPSSARAPTAQAAPTPDLTGRWAQLQRTTAVSDVTFVGEVISTTTALLLLEITRQGEGFTLRETVCAIDLASTADSVTMRIPPAFQRAVSGRTRPARLERDGAGWRYVQPMKIEVSGAQLKNPERDKLPDDEDDPRVTDPDRDGKPGLTVQVRGLIDGDIYVVQRDRSELTGTLSPDGTRVAGGIKWRAEQTVLDATSVFLSGDPPESAPHKDAKRSTFKMTRVAPGASCADLLAKRRSLFP